MAGPPWHVLARAEVTKRLAHGDRFLETRVFLGDGRIMEQVNTGVPDLENDWREVGRFSDLRAALRDLRSSGWRVESPLGGAPLSSRVFALLGGLLFVGGIGLAIAGSFAYVAALAVSVLFVAAALIARAPATRSARAAALIVLAGLAMVVFGLTATPLFIAGWALLLAGIVVASLSWR